MASYEYELQNVYLGAPNIPSAYQEVEWIWGSWTQYINTNYIPTVNTEIETDISWETQSQSWAVFWWVTGNDTSSDWILWRVYWNGSDTWSSQNFNVWFCNSTYGEFRRDLTLNTFHNITSKKNWWTTDWTSYTVTTSWTPYQSSMFIFCWNNGWSAWRHSKCKIKTFKISNSWTLVRDFVPCYRKSDNVIWFYDKVNNQFYTNAWSGSFTKWNNVN